MLEKGPEIQRGFYSHGRKQDEKNMQRGKTGKREVEL
jgi:hypothetical protein